MAEAMACGISEAYEAFEADGSTQHAPRGHGVRRAAISSQ